MKNILITGATGHLGAKVIESLLTQYPAGNIYALVRDDKSDKAAGIAAKGVQLRVADYDDYAALVAAFRGIHRLYFVSASDILKRIPQHENVVKAAQEAGVQHVVYTSFQRNNETAASPIAVVAEVHLKTEAWLKASGLDYTILKHNVYLEFLPMFLGEQVIQDGAIYLPAGKGKTAFLLRDDMAEAGAQILATEGHENKVYDIGGEEAVTFDDIAGMLSRISGKEIGYVSPSKEEFVQALTAAGVPAEGIGISAGFATAFAEEEFARTSPNIEQLLGRKPVSVETFLTSVYGA